MQIFQVGCLALAFCAVAVGQRTAPPTTTRRNVDETEVPSPLSETEGTDFPTTDRPNDYDLETTESQTNLQTDDFLTTESQTDFQFTLPTETSFNTDILVSIKLESYSNPENLLISGSNCDPFGWSKCDPYLTILYNTNNDL
jgi:hypothetical protein